MPEIQVTVVGRDKGLPANLFSGKGSAEKIPGSPQISRNNKSSP